MVIARVLVQHVVPEQAQRLDHLDDAVINSATANTLSVDAQSDIVAVIIAPGAAVGGRLGVKASGGIRTRADALALRAAGATRFGTSRSVALLAD